MSKSKTLNKRQRAVLDDLFAGEKGEPEVLKDHGVSWSLYERWLADERFARQFELRIARAYRQTRTILARKAPMAAKTLTELAGKGEAETTRKACLDVLAQQRSSEHQTSSDARPASQEPAPTPDLPPETATRLLAALAGQE